MFLIINYKGEIKNEEYDSVDVDDIAACCSKKSKIEIGQAIYHDLSTKYNLLSYKTTEFEFSNAFCSDTTLLFCKMTLPSSI